MTIPFTDVAGQLAFAQLWQVTLVIAAAALITRLACARRAHLAHLVWLVVLIKCLAPPFWSSPTGVFSWAMHRAAADAKSAGPTATNGATAFDERVASPVDQGLVTANLAAATHRPAASRASTSLPAAAMEQGPIESAGTFRQLVRLLLLGWAAGAASCAGFAVFVAVVSWRAVRRSRCPDDESATALLESLARRLDVRRKARLVLVNEPLGPMTFGWIRPAVIVPQQLIAGRPPAEIEPLLAHELVHVRRGDALVGLLQLAAQCLWWFHPLVWWANREIGRERERCCDEEVVAGLDCPPAVYARSLVNVLELKRQLRWLGPLPGLRPFEVTKQRLERLMTHSADFRARMPRAYWLLLLAGVLLLGPGARLATTGDESTAVSQKSETALSPEGANSAPARKTVAAGSRKNSRLPRLIESVPKAGQSDVSADLKEIRVTFDRDMGKGMSWTGSPESFYPPGDENLRARWINARTCVLPVKLEKGKYYRVGINSKSYRDFRSARGVSFPPAVVYFATEGASAEVRNRLRVPKIAELKPANGASDVDPSITELRVTFDVPMSKGMSWTGGGPSFPESPPDSRAEWTADGKTCVLPVSLRPGRSYRLGLNSLSFNNFQSASGVPLDPVVYRFKTH